MALAGAQQAAARARADASWRSELSALADARTANLLRTLAERGGPVAFQQPADSAEEAAAVSPHRAPLRTPKRKPGLAPLADHPGRSPLRQGPGDHLS